MKEAFIKIANCLTQYQNSRLEVLPISQILKGRTSTRPTKPTGINLIKLILCQNAKFLS